MPDVSLASMALRLAISMGVVVALMLLAAKVLRRAQAYAVGSAAGAGRRQGRVTRIPIAVSSITPLGKGASVAIVKAAGRELVVGITEHQVTLLHSAIETMGAIDAMGAIATEDAGWDPAAAELDDDPSAGLIDLDTPQRPSRALSTSAARIAALVPTSPHSQGSDGGSSAWTETLETLRARTVRR